MRQVMGRPKEAKSTLELEDLRVVKEDGQKADDAAVPIHLWDEMYLLARHLDDTIIGDPPSRWREGLAMMRTCCLGWWRLQCF